MRVREWTKPKIVCNCIAQVANAGENTFALPWKENIGQSITNSGSAHKVTRTQDSPVLQL